MFPPEAPIQYNAAEAEAWRAGYEAALDDVINMIATIREGRG